MHEDRIITLEMPLTHHMKRLKQEVDWSKTILQTKAPPKAIVDVRMGLIDGLSEEEIAHQYNLDITLVQKIAAMFLEDIEDSENGEPSSESKAG